jgi:hypothetical protein
MTRAPAPDVPAPVGLSVEVDQEGAKGTTFAIARSACLAIWETDRIAKDARGEITDRPRKEISTSGVCPL